MRKAIRRAGKLVGVTALSAAALITAVSCGNRGAADGSFASGEESKTITYGKAAGPYTVPFEDAIIPIL